VWRIRLKEIYPRPDPIVVQGVEQMQFGIGSVMVLKDVLGAFKTVNAQAGIQDQLHPEQLEPHHRNWLPSGRLAVEQYAGLHH